ncbi:uncharacterized protein LOC131596843 [Vicia villosa]|uniref:uncharacterized protein LOC131596843 n=1 Tax=Vicia villosa TaxID=3911 RepID=UPI00273AAFAB|nr:uncharacterized protein LOC131596843 [Vicia villosa]
MKPPSQLIKTKGAPKKLKPTPNDNSTTLALSYCEHVNKLFPDSLTPKSQKSQTRSNKGARISKPPSTPIPPKIPIIEEMPIPPKISFIEQMSVFMHKYIKRIINVAENGNCGYRAVSPLLGNGEDSHTLVRQQLIQELNMHKDSSTRLYGDEVKFEAVNEYLGPWLGAYAPVSKWMKFPEMGHLIASAYGRVYIDLTRYGFSKTFSPSAPHLLETEMPIPPTSSEWALHHSEDAET